MILHGTHEVLYYLHVVQSSIDLTFIIFHTIIKPLPLVRMT